MTLNTGPLINMLMRTVCRDCHYREIPPEEGLEVRVFQIHQTMSLPVTAECIAKACKSDRVIRQVLKYTRQGWPATHTKELQPYFSRRQELSVENQCLLWGIRVIVPTSLQKQLLADLHQNHPGMSKMKMVARGHFWWPGLDGDIEALAKSCQPCHEAKQSPPKAPLHPWSWPSKPWQRIHLDLAGPFMGKMFLLAIDAHSKWGEVWEMASTTSLKTIYVDCLQRMAYHRWSLVMNRSSYQLNLRPF